jgi:hypothetical protein
MDNIAKDSLQGKFHLGQHLCSIYKTDEQEFSPLILYFSEALKANQKCVYILDNHTENEIKEVFANENIEINTYQNKRQFKFVTKETTYLKDGYFDVDKMINFIKESGEEALKEGFSGLRGTGGISWAINDKSIMEKMFDYELKLNKRLFDSKISALCQYDERFFPKEFLVKVIRSHPYFIIYGKYYENKYFYTSPEYVSQANIPEDSYETMIKIITED